MPLFPPFPDLDAISFELALDQLSSPYALPQSVAVLSRRSAPPLSNGIRRVTIAGSIRHDYSTRMNVRFATLITRKPTARLPPSHAVHVAKEKSLATRLKAEILLGLACLYR